MKDNTERDEILVFSSELGWMCLRTRGEAIRQLSFGHASAAAAHRIVTPGRTVRQKPNRWQMKVIRRLQRYAEGAAVDFCDLRVDLARTRDFGQPF